ncbi:MAG: hypothetical protein KME27_13510 [Lyngbya sp. HA4199-MV5]|jgi:hypothetical protein|nr:hypothetical protein [Lyngbya sp. HA4199-MV5]
MANEMDAMVGTAQFMAGSVPAGQTAEVTTSETRSRTIVGPVEFKLQNLRVRGLGTKPADPSNSPFIIAEDEQYEVAVDVLFNRTPLTELLMCLGTRIIIDFGLEGYGKNAPEVDVQATLVTTKDQYSYQLIHRGIARRDGLKPGLYEIGAVATVGPVENRCTTKIWGHGYIKEVLLEVYASGQD